MSRRQKSIAAVLAAMLLIAGVVITLVSASSGTSLQSYVAKADAICTVMNPQIYTTIQNISTAEGQNSKSVVASAMDAFSNLGDRELRHIKALTQPSQDSGMIKRFYSADASALRATRAAMVYRSSPATLNRSKQDTRAVYRLATRIGFKSCSQTQNIAQT